MPKILAALAILATAVFFALPSPANAAAQSQDAKADQSTAATDVSARHRRHWRGHRYRHRGGYYGFAPRPYYGYGYYRPHRGYWGGPRIFPYGPWW